MKKISFLITCIFFSVSMMAQRMSEVELCRKAEESYKVGRFEEAEKLLKENISSLTSRTRATAYHLLTLCALEQDKSQEADYYASLLLKENPYYTVTLSDPLRFADMIEEMKSGMAATITTASQNAETLDEVPVPVTLITEDMIRKSGARNLKELIVQYVPGATDIASNDEMNLAMRGVYSSNQEKMLIMLNGHRLNSYATNISTPDFSISLDKIKQIEVLRGPASSIYGGVALTGVVNIITKDGRDVDGLKVKSSVGNYGQVSGGMLFGKQYFDTNILLWGNIYNSSGEKVHLNATVDDQPYSVMPLEGDMILGAYNHNPSYDIGMNIKWKDWHILYNRTFSKVVYPLSLSYYFTPYSYDSFLKWNNNKPGNAITSDHAEIGFEKKINKASVKASVYYDAMKQQRYQAVGDTIPVLFDIIFSVFPYGTTDISVPLLKGVFQSTDFYEHTAGFNIQSVFDYKLGNNHSGSLLIGGHANFFSLDNSSYMEGYLFDTVLKVYKSYQNDFDTAEGSKYLATGTEFSEDFYLQVKHNISDRFIFNVGVRQDFKRRRNHVTNNVFSPRIAFVLKQPKYSLKVSYSKAFVDAPYFYRYGHFDVNQSTEALLPEYLNSFQLSFYSDEKIAKGFFLDANLFYNIASDFIIPTAVENLNAGEMKTMGAEIITRFKTNRFSSELNMSAQKVLSSKNCNTYGNYIMNIPMFSGNAILSYDVLKNLTVSGNAAFCTKQRTEYTLPMSEPLVFDLPGRVIANLGATYNWRNLELSATVHNLFNKRYELGGSSVAPMRQQGRWFMVSIGYNFK